jgi:predicted acyl esterase
MTPPADAQPRNPDAGDVGRRDFVASVLGAAACLALPRVHDGEQESADYTLLSDVMVAMRDGVRLATDVYIPVGRAAPAGHSAIPGHPRAYAVQQDGTEPVRAYADQRNAARAGRCGRRFTRGAGS